MKAHWSRLGRGHRYFLLLVVAVVVMGGTWKALADKPGGKPPQSHAFGRSLSERYALYWQWVLD